MEIGRNVMKHAKTISRLGVTLFAVMALTGCQYSIGPFEEPAYRGKVVDDETRLPLPGTLIYGYYATSEGSFTGGESIKAVLHSFEVEADATGAFEIPAWNSGYALVRGAPSRNFPHIAIYKPGYHTYQQHLTSLSQWDSWGNGEFRLKKTLTEKDRYAELVNSADAFRYADDEGRCAWEKHTKLLLAQHVEWKDFLKRNVPTESLDKDGYPKSNFFHPNLDLRNRLQTRSGVDRLFESFSKNEASWKCKNLQKAFGALQK